ncbi:MAG: PKD domain-containing protein [Candidatus Omnitrophota bacterium]
MRKFFYLVLLVLFLSGCATYKFSHDKMDPKGFVASRADYPIIEYTVGKENILPEDLNLAKERFKRRKNKVEDYYKKMGYVDSRFKETFINWPKFFLGMITGVFRLPFAAVSDYKYEHNAKYREEVKKREARDYELEEARIRGLKVELNKYVQKDLKVEEEEKVINLTTVKAEQIKQGPVPPETIPQQAMLPVVEVKSTKQEEPPVVSENKTAVEPLQPEIAPKVVSPELVRLPQAFIMAKPIKGYSPLKVRFYGNKSFSPSGKIVSYLWDFGDGDTSIKINPMNTFYSTTFEPKYFIVTLTVFDNLGNTAAAKTTIEVLNK